MFGQRNIWPAEHLPIDVYNVDQQDLIFSKFTKNVTTGAIFLRTEKITARISLAKNIAERKSKIKTKQMLRLVLSDRIAEYTSA